MADASRHPSLVVSFPAGASLPRMRRRHRRMYRIGTDLVRLVVRKVNLHVSAGAMKNERKKFRSKGSKRGALAGLKRDTEPVRKAKAALRQRRYRQRKRDELHALGSRTRELNRTVRQCTRMILSSLSSFDTIKKRKSSCPTCFTLSYNTPCQIAALYRKVDPITSRLAGTTILWNMPNPPSLVSARHYPS